MSLTWQWAEYAYLLRNFLTFLWGLEKLGGTVKQRKALPTPPQLILQRKNGFSALCISLTSTQMVMNNMFSFELYRSLIEKSLIPCQMNPSHLFFSNLTFFSISPPLQMPFILNFFFFLKLKICSGKTTLATLCFHTYMELKQM